MLTTATLPSDRHSFEPNHTSSNSIFSPSNFFDRPSHHHRRQKVNFRHTTARKAHENERIEQANREAEREVVRSEAEEASRHLARSYLERFLETSEWQDQVDGIGIIDEAVPTMEDLEGYGALDEAEGTRACRKMFKAVVVWEQIGHSLWEKLRDEESKRDEVDKIARDEANPAPAQPATHHQEETAGRQSHHGTRDSHGLSIIMEQPNETQTTRRSSLSSFAPSLSRGRKASLSSLISPDRRATHSTPSSSSPRPPPIARRSSSVPVSSKSRRALHGDCDCGEDLEHDCPRRATDPGPQPPPIDWHTHDSHEDGPSEAGIKAAATFPRRLSKNCANAVRRTFEALHDSRGKHASHRRASLAIDRGPVTVYHHTL